MSQDTNAEFVKQLRDSFAQTASEHRADRFEQRCVEAILKYAKYELATSLLRKDRMKSDNKATLDFAWFSERFQTFPVKLYADKLRHTYNISWANLFGSGFSKQPWVKKYLDYVTSDDLDLNNEWAALIFVVPHADQANLMAIHNRFVGQEFAEEGLVSCTKIVRRMDRLDTSLVIEPLASFVEATGKNWHHTAG